MIPRSETATRTRPITSQLPNTIAGLWVLLVQNQGELPEQDADGRVPVMCAAGNGQTYLLVFKHMVKARQFAQTQGLDEAEARMVVRANHEDMLRIARSAKAAGTLIDFDPTTQQYAGTGALA